MTNRTSGNAHSGGGSTSSQQQAADIVQAETAHNDGTEKVKRVPLGFEKRQEVTKERPAIPAGAPPPYVIDAWRGFDNEDAKEVKRDEAVGAVLTPETEHNTPLRPPPAPKVQSAPPPAQAPPGNANSGQTNKEAEDILQAETAHDDGSEKKVKRVEAVGAALTPETEHDTPPPPPPAPKVQSAPPPSQAPPGNANSGQTNKEAEDILQAETAHDDGSEK